MRRQWISRNFYIRFQIDFKFDRNNDDGRVSLQY